MTPIIRGATLAFIADGLAGILYTQRFIDLGSSGPTSGPKGIYPVSFNGDQTRPDGLNYLSCNHPSVSPFALGGV